MKAIFLTAVTAALLLVAPAAEASCHGPFLGVSYDNIDQDKATAIGADHADGVYITRVYDGTAADKAGLKPFDYIVGVNDQQLGKDGSLGHILSNYQEGEKVTLHVVRDGKTIKKTARLGNRSDMTHANDRYYDTALLGVYKGYGGEGAGVPINKLVGCSKADKVGMAPMDRIVSINGREMYDWADIKIMINNMKPEDKIKIELLRGGYEMTYKTRLGTKGEQPCDVVEPETEPEVLTQATELGMLVEDATEEEAGNALREAGSEFSNSLEVADLNLFPNPNNGNFSLRFDLAETGRARVMIVNSTGQTVFSDDLGDFSGQYTGKINLSEHGAGLYFLQITQNGKALSKKLLVK